MADKPKRVSPDQQHTLDRRNLTTNQIAHIRQDAIDAVNMAANGDTLSAIHNLHAAVIRLCELLEAQL